jgi:NAD(P)-dependent dehydrogenase (short-subunit alcohol dehydrogenase family)
LVTGTSSGIGLATAVTLAQRGLYGLGRECAIQPEGAGEISEIAQTEQLPLNGGAARRKTATIPCARLFARAGIVDVR